MNRHTHQANDTEKSTLSLLCQGTLVTTGMPANGPCGFSYSTTRAAKMKLGSQETHHELRSTAPLLFLRTWCLARSGPMNSGAHTLTDGVNGWSSVPPVPCQGQSSLLCEGVFLDSLCFSGHSLQQDRFSVGTSYEVRRCIGSSGMGRSSLPICAMSAHRSAHTRDPRLLAMPRPPHRVVYMYTKMITIRFRMVPMIPSIARTLSSLLSFSWPPLSSSLPLVMTILVANVFTFLPRLTCNWREAAERLWFMNTLPTAGQIW